MSASAFSVALFVALAIVGPFDVAARTQSTKIFADRARAQRSTTP
jgi:hypothetical protein